MINKNFAHLHLHTHYSFLDGYGSPASRAKKAKELGMNAIAITDHNHLGGCLEFQKACKDEDIKPILGVELYYTKDTNMLSKDAKIRYELALEAAEKAGVIIPPKAKKKDIKELIAPYQYDTKQHHLLFLAKNQTGWNNLVKLQSEAAKVCTYNGRFICDDNMINKYKDGLIVTTACLGSIINRYIMKERFIEAYAQLDKWRNMFGENLYIEIQPLNEPDQALCNYHLIQYAVNNNIKLVATNDVHYTNQSDIDDHDTLLCVGIGKLKSDEERMRYKPEFWMRSYDEMIEAFTTQYHSNEYLSSRMGLEEYIETVKQALSNTNLIASQVEAGIKLGSDTTILPKLEIPNGFTAEQYLTLLSYKGLFRYLSDKPELNLQEYLDRLAFELNVINTKGYADYMLIYRDIVEWCQNEGIPVGPGRGSASGSLCLFVNGITKCIDPIKYGLLFSRFLTMDRTALPDIDSDFSYLNRHRVIQYLKDKYGEDCVSFIGTYTEMGVKSGLKDVGRVLNIDFATMNSISKKIDEWTGDAPSVKFKDLDKLENGDNKDKSIYTEFKKYENNYSELFRLARSFEGTPRNQGVHASGILVTPMPINNLFPTRVDKDGSLVTLYTGPQCESLGACKLDILGLKTLDVMDLTIKAVNPNATVYELYELVDNYLDNEEMFSALCNKETEGIFQLESNLFKNMIFEILPKSINDISVITSLGRPGPLSAKMDKIYAKISRGELEPSEPLRGTWDIVKNALGTICYQEHVMRISQVVAGFDDNQADSYLRKALAKKDSKKMELCKQWFIYGKVNAEDPAEYSNLFEDKNSKNRPYYDPKGEYGSPILGGVNNGYTAEELEEFWENIKGYASYLFNASHAACYSFISVCTMYLKTFHKTEFFAALLSLQSTQEKIDLYCNVAQNYGIEISTPDINLSNENFTAKDNKILYGLGSIKGVGASAIPTLIACRPYADIADAYEKAGKKACNKKIGESLIKAGAFNFQDINRNNLLNIFQDIRKAKKEERFDETAYNEDVCTEYEKEVLGCAITYRPFWDTVHSGETVSVELELIKVNERKDKNGNMMGFITAKIGKLEVKGVAFASIYCKNVSAFDVNINSTVYAKVKKDDKGGFIVNRVLEALPKLNIENPKPILQCAIDEFNTMMDNIA